MDREISFWVSVTRSIKSVMLLSDPVVSWSELIFLSWARATVLEKIPTSSWAMEESAWTSTW